jgi:hypothetical protein
VAVAVAGAVAAIDDEEPLAGDIAPLAAEQIGGVVIRPTFRAGS